MSGNNHPPANPRFGFEETLIGFRFEGGVANRGQLNFYEAGRYRYAAARMLYTIEHFRNTGTVLQRLNRFAEAEFLVGPAEKGSFLDIVTQYAAPIVSDAHSIQESLQIPFGRVFSYILSKIVPTAMSSNRLGEIAQKQIDLLAETQRTAQAREQTAQIQAEQQTEQLKAIVSLLRDDKDNKRDNLKDAQTVSKIVESNSQGAAKLSIGDESAQFILSEIEAEIRRNDLVEDYETELDKIDPNDEQDLIDKVRRLLPEVAVPLRRSANAMNLELGRAQPIAVFNQKRIAQIRRIHKDENTITLFGSIKKLDKETGYGRFRPTGSRSTLSFSIPTEIFHEQRSTFIEAFREIDIPIEAHAYRDGIGNIVKLSIIRVYLVGLEPAQL